MSGNFYKLVAPDAMSTLTGYFGQFLSDGSVATLSPGSPATLIGRLYSMDSSRNLTLIAGETGEPGGDGPIGSSGAKGEPGKTTVGLNSVDVSSSQLSYESGGAFFDDALGAIVLPQGVSSAVIAELSLPRRWDTEGFDCQIAWYHGEVTGVGGYDAYFGLSHWSDTTQFGSPYPTWDGTKYADIVGDVDIAPVGVWATGLRPTLCRVTINLSTETGFLQDLAITVAGIAGPYTEPVLGVNQIIIDLTGLSIDIDGIGFFWPHASPTYSITSIEFYAVGSSTDGDVTFSLSAKCFNNLSPISITYGSPTSLSDTGGDDTLRYLTPQSTNIAIAGYPSKNSDLCVKISRSAGDTLLADVRIKRVRFFYPADQPTDDDTSVVNHVALDESNNLIYISSGSKGIEVVNISNPAIPSLVTSYPTDGRVKKCVIMGSYLYQMDADFGLRIYSIATPGVLVLVGELKILGVRDIAVSEDGLFVFFAGRDNNLVCVDTSVKAAPVLISRDNAGVLTSCLGVGVNAGVLYVCGGDLYAFDLSLFTADMSVALVGTHSTLDARAVSFHGTVAYVAKSGSGVESVDITTPSSITTINTYNGTGNTLAVVGDGTHVYSADRYPGCRKLSSSLTYQSVMDVQGQSNSVEVGAANIYVSNAIYGITIADKATMLPISYFTTN